MLSLRANSVSCDFFLPSPVFAILLLCRYLQAGLLGVVFESTQCFF